MVLKSYRRGFEVRLTLVFYGKTLNGYCVVTTLKVFTIDQFKLATQTQPHTHTHKDNNK